MRRMDIQFQPADRLTHVLYQLDEQEAIRQLQQKSGQTSPMAETAYWTPTVEFTFSIHFQVPKALKIQLLMQRLEADFPTIIWKKLTVNKETAAAYQLVFIPAKSVQWIATNPSLTKEQSTRLLVEEYPLQTFTEQVQALIEAALFVPLLKEEGVQNRAKTADSFTRLQTALSKIEQRKKQLIEEAEKHLDLQAESPAHLSSLPVSSKNQLIQKFYDDLHQIIKQKQIDLTPIDTQKVKSPKPKKKLRIPKFAGAIFAIIFLGLLAFVLWANFSLAQVEGDSMTPALEDGDWILMYKNSDLLERGDIISFDSPDKSGEVYLKRVVGLPGDTIDIEDNKLYIDDKEVKLEENVADYDLNDATGCTKIPKGKVFVLGDNLNKSRDSREFGFVDLSTIKGILLWSS